LEIADFLFLALFAFGDFVQEYENVIYEDLTKFAKGYLVRPFRIFFEFVL